MDYNLLSMNTMLLFLLIMIRITGLIMTAPFFSQQGVPVIAKAWFSALLAVILFPFYSHAGQLVLPTDMWMFSFLAVKEFVVGMLLGFTVTMVFGAVQLAGSHLTMQMGMSMAQVVDPISNAQTPIMGQFLFIVAILAFLMLGMHHSMIVALVRTFEYLPVGNFEFHFGALAERFLTMADNMFMMSVMLIFPIMGIMLVLEIALAFASKIMPQMNIFMVSLPLKVSVALILLMITLPFIMESLVRTFAELEHNMYVLYKT